MRDVLAGRTTALDASRCMDINAHKQQQYPQILPSERTQTASAAETEEAQKKTAQLLNPSACGTAPGISPRVMKIFMKLLIVNVRLFV